MKRYDKYKPSGIDWIGEVPEMWKIERLKFLFSHSNAGVWGDDEKGNKDDIVCFRVADFNYEKGCLFLEDNTIRNIDEKSLKGRLIKQNDLLIEKSGGGDNAPVGRVVKVNTDIRATCSNFIHFLTVDKYNDAAFLFYYFKFLYANKINLLFFNQTTGIQNLKLSAYLGQMAFMPSLPEQTAIADYLDAKCSKIDNVVEVQRKRIELLKELKQSIITHAVTKGLNKNAKLKDSGIDWIGDVPKGWTVEKISWIFRIGSGTTPSSGNNAYYVEENGFNWLQTGDLNDGIVTETSKYITKKAIQDCNLKTYKKGSLVIAMYGATIGKVGLLGIDTTVNQACCVLSKSSRMYENYAFYVFQAGKPALLRESYGGGQPNISQDIISSQKYPLPPLDEQTAIAAYLDKKCAAIDGQIAKVERQIELLNEYKQSVITECVTGKRKVC